MPISGYHDSPKRQQLYLVSKPKMFQRPISLRIIILFLELRLLLKVIINSISCYTEVISIKGDDSILILPFE